MKRYKNLLAPEVQAELLAAGCGLGIGDAYQPWQNVHDFRSHGVRVRARWHRSDRIHHLFSTLEFWHFRQFAADPTVIDIREQFPLLDRDRLDHAMRVTKERFPKSRVGSRGGVLSTDLVVTRVVEGSQFDEPYSVKY